MLIEKNVHLLDGWLVMKTFQKLNEVDELIENEPMSSAMFLEENA